MLYILFLILYCLVIYRLSAIGQSVFKRLHKVRGFTKRDIYI